MGEHHVYIVGRHLAAPAGPALSQPGQPHCGFSLQVSRLTMACITGRRNESAELSFKVSSKGQRCAVFEIRSDDLHSNRQTGRRPIDGRCCYWEAARCGRIRPHQTCVVVRDNFAVNFEPSRLNRQRMIVGKGRDWGRRVENDVPFSKEQAPLLLEVPTRLVSGDPIAMAHDGAACALGLKAVVFCRQDRGQALLLLVKVKRYVRSQDGCHKAHIEARRVRKVRYECTRVSDLHTRLREPIRQPAHRGAHSTVRGYKWMDLDDENAEVFEVVVPGWRQCRAVTWALIFRTGDRIERECQIRSSSGQRAGYGQVAAAWQWPKWRRVVSAKRD